jgi:surfeit locus 1 family protein
VTGLFRQPHQRAWFMPGDNIAANQWFSRDPQAYAAASGLPPERVAPYIIDARSDPNLPGGLPQGGETIVSFANDHLQYAITWFGLAGAVAIAFGVWLYGQRRS